ncbi:unnamed protein product, partial [Prorocentrum cordatum]
VSTAACRARGPLEARFVSALRWPEEAGEEAAAAAAAAREAAREAARAHGEEQRGVLEKYDGDGDGFLSRVELGVLAEEQYALRLPDDALDALYGGLAEARPVAASRAGAGADGAPEEAPAPELRGVPVGAWQRLRVALGIRRELVRDRARRAAREVRQGGWQCDLEQTLAEVGGLEAQVAEAQGEGEGLGELGEGTPAAELARALAQAAQRLLDLEHREWLLQSGTAREIRARAGTMLAALKAAAAVHAEFRKRVVEKSNQESEIMQTKVANVLQAHADDCAVFIATVDGENEGNGVLSRDDVLGFLRPRWEDPVDEFPEEAVTGWLSQLAGSNDGVAREALLRPQRVRYRVEKNVALTDGLNVKESTVLRRLRPGEFVFLLDSPILEDVFQVIRIKVRTSTDAAVGYVTIKGNLGTTYIQSQHGAADRSDAQVAS